MDETLQGVRDLYAVVGLTGGVVIVLIGLLLVVWRSGVRAKDDPTKELVSVIKQGQDTNRELTTEFVENGKRQDAQSKAHVNALTAISEELKEGRKVQTGLVDIVQAVNTNVIQTRADISEIAVKQAARAAGLHDEVLQAIAEAQGAILSELTQILNDAIKEIKAALNGLLRRRGTSANVRRSISALETKIEKLSKDVKDYANTHTRPPDVTQTVSIGADGVDATPKPIYSVLSTGQRPVLTDAKPSVNGAGHDHDRYPNAPDWIRGGRR